METGLVAGIRRRVAATMHMGLDDEVANDPEGSARGHDEWVERVQEWADWVHEQYAPHLAAVAGLRDERDRLAAELAELRAAPTGRLGDEGAATRPSAPGRRWVTWTTVGPGGGVDAHRGVFVTEGRGLADVVEDDGSPVCVRTVDLTFEGGPMSDLAQQLGDLLCDGRITEEDAAEAWTFALWLSEPCPPPGGGLADAEARQAWEARWLPYMRGGAA